MYRIEKQSAKEFYNLNKSHLLKNESLYNIIFGWSQMIAQGKRSEETSIFYTVFKDDQVTAQAIRTDNERDLLITELPPESIDLLIQRLKADNQDLPGINGPIHTTELFLKKYEKKHRLSLHQGVYELNNVIMPSITGSVIKGTNEHKDIIYNYLLGFMRDCFPKESNHERSAKNLCERYIDEGTFRLLMDKQGNIVSMANKNRETDNAATISLVYTPPQERGKGHASQIVALISQEMLDSGKKLCNLHTDLSNPTSNSIYQKIGYKKVGELINYKFIN